MEDYIMIRKITRAIADKINCDRLYASVVDVASYHRIQASTGFRAAANYCNDKLNRLGVPSEILSYPANYEKMFLCSPSFQEWDIKGARCTLVEPFEWDLADFDGDAISVIQRSCACNYMENGLEILLMDKGTSPENYEGVDFTDKLLFISEDFNNFGWALEKGALGFISDHVAVSPTRSRSDMRNLRKYTSFWKKSENDIMAFGYVITPQMGDKLRKACYDMAAQGKLPKAKCFVDASFYDGALENVSAVLPGTSGKEILITAHLCHPRASANDNASGVAAGIEALNVINMMIKEGKLKPLTHSIRLLLIPEFAGTYAYFDAIGEDKKKALAGINLDMVGGKQNGLYGPLTLTSLPYSTPSFVSNLANLVLDELKKDADALDGHKVPMFNSTVAEFTGGSDHVVLSDPTIGVPAPMLGQFPDFNYHTNGDTPDVVDPYILHKSCAIAASYAYILATLDEEAMPEIFAAQMRDMVKKLSEISDKANEGEIKGTSNKAFDHVTRFYVDSCDHLKAFIRNNDLEIQSQKDRLLSVAKTMFELCGGKGEEIAVDESKVYVPKRLFTGPIDRLHVFAKTDEQKAAIAHFNKNIAPLSKGNRSFAILVVFYMDGVRTNAEIARLIAADMGIDSFELINGYIELLITLGLAKK